MKESQHLSPFEAGQRELFLEDSLKRHNRR